MYVLAPPKLREIRLIEQVTKMAAWMRQQQDDNPHHGVVQFSSFFGCEAVGDSEVSVHPIMNMEFCTPDDDDAESCNGGPRDSSDVTFIDDYSSNKVNDDDDADDNYQEYENVCSYDNGADNYYQGDSRKCQKMGISDSDSDSDSGSVHLEGNNKDSRVGISTIGGDDNNHHEHEDQMNDQMEEKSKLFWDSCLGIGEE